MLADQRGASGNPPRGLAIERCRPRIDKAPPELWMFDLHKEASVLQVSVVDDLIHRADGSPRQAQFLTAMPGFLKRDAGEEMFEGRGNMRYIGLDCRRVLVLFIQQILRQA